MRILAAVVGLATLLQQTPAAGPPMQKIVLNVTDQAGRYVQGLRPEDFMIEEDGVVQKITGFAPSSDTPLSLGMLIDKSTSMRLPLVVEGAQPMPAALLGATGVGRALIRLMGAQDEFLLMTFDEDLKVKQDFTQDRKKLNEQLYKLHEVGGATHLYDSVIKALDKMKKAKYRRRALIVMTDAYDTSGKQLEDMQRRFGEQEIPIYVFGLRSIWEGLADQSLEEPLFKLVLTTISKESGGLSLVVSLPEYQSDSTIESMIAFAQIIAMELRGQYTLGYNSESSVPMANRVIRVRTNSDFRVRIRRDALEPVSVKK